MCTWEWALQLLSVNSKPMHRVSRKLTEKRQLRQPARCRHHAMRCSQQVAQQLSSPTQVTAVAGKYNTKPYRRIGCTGMKVK